MKTIIILLMLLFLNRVCEGQTCQQQLGEATTAYYNGQLREVVQLLESCVNSNGLTKHDQIDALKLLANTHILLNQDSEADMYMAKFLSLHPTYELRDDDLAEFRSLYDSYDVRTKYTFGFSVGALIPDYIIMRHQSYSGQTVEPSDFDEIPGISIGVTGEYSFYKNFFLNGSILYSQRSFKQREEIMEYQEVSSYERDYYLDVPFQIRYVFNTGKVKPFAGGGYALHYLIHSKGDIDHVPLAPDFPMVIGVPELVDNYDLTGLRRRFTHNWVVSAGIMIDFKHSLLELRGTYQIGLNNLIDKQSTHTNRELVETYAYIPDDYRVNSLVISLVYSRNILKPNKRKP